MKRYCTQIVCVFLLMSYLYSPLAMAVGETAQATAQETAIPSDAETTALQTDVSNDINVEVQKTGGTLSFDTFFKIWNKTSNVMTKGAGLGAKLLDLIPKSFLNDLIQKKAGLKQVAIGKGIPGFKNSFTINAVEKIGGVDGTVAMLYAPVVPGGKKGGNSLTFSIPKGTPVEKLIPGANISALGTIPIADMKVILSDFEYTDSSTNYPIAKGLNIIVALDPTSIGVFNLDKVKKALQIEGGAIIGVLTITKTPAEEAATGKKVAPKFKVIIPPNAIKVKEFKVSELTDLLNMPMPAKVQAELSKIVVHNLDLGIDFTTNNQKFELSGEADVFGAHNVKTVYKIYKAAPEAKEGATQSPNETIWVNSLALEFPNQWSIASALPELKVLAPLSIKHPTISIVSRSSATARAGVSFSGALAIGALGSNPVLKTLGSVLGQEVTIFGVMSKDLADAQFIVAFGSAKGAKVSLGDLIPSKFGSLKQQLSKGSLTLNTVDMSFGGKNATQSLRITGMTDIAGVKAKTEVKVMYVANEWKGDLILNLPQKVQGVNAELDKLSDLPISSLTLALIQVPYTDPATGIEFQEGLNIGGYMGFTGKMSFVEKLFHVKGLDINGVMDIQHPTSGFKLEAMLPGNQSLQLGKDVKMEKLKVYMVLGAAPEVGLEGTMKITLPKGFRPKKGSTSIPTGAMAAIDQSIFIDIPLGEQLNDMILHELALSTDSQETAVEEDIAGSTAGNTGMVTAAAQASDTNDIVITEEKPETPEAPTPTGTEEGEIPSPVDENVTPDMQDTDIDMSGYGDPVPDNSQVTLVGALAVKGEDAVLSCAMDGAVDIKGLVLKDVAFEAQVAMAVPPIPTGVGFRATLELTQGAKPKVMDFAAKMAAGTTTSSIAWIGSYKGGLYFSDLVNVAFTVTKRAPGANSAEGKKFRKEFFDAMKKVPKIGIDELSIAIVPIPTTIAGKSYEEGTSADAKFVLFGARGEIAIQIGYTGTSGTGSLSKVALPRSKPQFILSSFDGSQGPSVSFNIGKGKLVKMGNAFTIDGNIEIKPLAMKSATLITMTPTGGDFKMVDNAFGLYQTELEGSLFLNKIDKARFKGTFKQDAINKFTGILRENAKVVLEEGKKELDKARQDIIKEFDGKIASARETVRKEREKATGSVSGAEKDAQTKINKEIEETRKRIGILEGRDKRFKKECKHANIKSCGEIIKNGTELAAKKTYLEALLKPGKQVAHGTLEAAKGTVNLTPIDSDPRVSSMIAGKEAALAGIKAGQAGAKGIAEMEKGLATAADQTLNIKSVSFEVSMGDLIKGKLPKFSIDGIVMGKKLHVKDLQLDLKKPGDIKKLAQSIIHGL